MRKLVFLIFLALFFLLAGCVKDKPINNKAGEETPGSVILNSVYCNEDSDCVPSECCHPKSCVNVGFKPDCSGIFCSMECAPGTMDCGQGSCGCVKNKCTAAIE